jgi:hypothetical protein
MGIVIPKMPVNGHDMDKRLSEINFHLTKRKQVKEKGL